MKKSIITFETVGNQNNPPILFIHGLCWTRSLWLTVTEGLQDDYFLILLDLPAHGESGKLDDYSFENISREINRLKQNLIPEKKVTIIGSSVGASIGLVYSSLYNHVDHLILVDGGYFPFK